MIETRFDRSEKSSKRCLNDTITLDLIYFLLLRRNGIESMAKSITHYWLCRMGIELNSRCAHNGIEYTQQSNNKKNENKTHNKNLITLKFGTRFTEKIAFDRNFDSKIDDNIC